MCRSPIRHYVRLALAVVFLALGISSPGCGWRVRLEVGDEGKTAPDALLKELDTQPEYLAPSKILKKLSMVPFYSNEQFADCQVTSDDELLCLNNREIIDVKLQLSEHPIKTEFVEAIPIPYLGRIIHFNEQTISILCNDQWFRATWWWGHEYNHDRKPRWAEYRVVPKNTREVIDAPGGLTTYILEGSQVEVESPYWISDPVHFPGTITTATVVMQERLVCAVESEGVYLTYPFQGKDKKTPWKVADVTDATCLLIEGNKLIVGNADGMLKVFAPPTMWVEQRLWDEQTSLNLNKPISAIHPYYHGNQLLFLVSIEGYPVELVGFDKDGKLVDAGRIEVPTGEENLAFSKCKRTWNLRDSRTLVMDDTGHLFLLAPKDDGTEMQLVDTQLEASISENAPAAELIPPPPTPIYGTFGPGFPVNKLVPFNNKLAVCGDLEIAVYDISSPLSPLLENIYSIERADSGIHFKSHPGIFGSKDSNGSLKLYDLNTPDGQMPHLVTTLELAPSAFWVGGYEMDGILFLYQWNSPILVYDVKNPSKPKIIGGLGDVTIEDVNQEWFKFDDGLFYSESHYSLFQVDLFAKGGPVTLGHTEESSTNPPYKYKIIKPGYRIRVGSGNTLQNWDHSNWVDLKAELPTRELWPTSFIVAENLLSIRGQRGVEIYDTSSMPDFKLATTIVNSGSLKDIAFPDGVVYCAYKFEGIIIYQLSENGEPGGSPDEPGEF